MCGNDHDDSDACYDCASDRLSNAMHEVDEAWRTVAAVSVDHDSVYYANRARNRLLDAELQLTEAGIEFARTERGRMELTALANLAPVASTERSTLLNMLDTAEHKYH